ncbi:MAG: zinc-dependent peptidase [Niastella sp.]|nr:zinc-dependent peptidase [Niastella sp.]
MPQDSTYILMGFQGDTVYRTVQEPVRTDTALLLQRVHVMTGKQQYRADWVGNWLFGIFMGVLLIRLFFPRFPQRLRLFFYSLKAKGVYDDKQIDYHAILQQYLPYYRNLPPAEQERFVRRTVVFMTTKQFEYVEIAPEERMPLLISATAVQLTFGLEHYLMEHFEKIYVMHHDYHYGFNSVPFQGHVTHDGIYLSWSNFLKGYDNYQDGDNVGLHEMAHALAYVNFNVEDGRDDDFHDRFVRFSRTGRAVFEDMQSDHTGGFLGRYAATRYEEFWAVCVENFFERPTSFKIQLPELYAAMCVLLNQDILTGNVLLSPVENV